MAGEPAWKPLGNMGGVQLIEASSEQDAEAKSKANPTALVYWPQTQ